MSRLVTVREHARLTTQQIAPSLDQATISPSAFDWLCRMGSGFGKSGAKLLFVDDNHWLRLENHVGVVQTPCGTTIEILPKHHDDGNDVARSRRVLCQMIANALDLPARESGAADLAAFHAPASEWLMRQFLRTLAELVHRGVRSDYQRIEEEERFLRGQLDMARQLRQPPGRAHHFHIRHDVFLPDCAENRIIRSTLDLVCRQVGSPDSWREANELRSLVADLPPSGDIARDLRLWRSERLLAHYRAIKPWCELILGQHMPMATRGTRHGISMLFPMERLFERYVQTALRRQLVAGARLASQSAGAYLSTHEGRGFFQMRPDFLVEANGGRWVLDAKWKRLDGQQRGASYGLSQSDFYQLFAYGHKFGAGPGQPTELVLVYPHTDTFSAPLPAFSLTEDMTLWVVPFELCGPAGHPRMHLPEEMALRGLMRMDRQAGTSSRPAGAAA